MKLTQFRKLIREEVRRVVSEERKVKTKLSDLKVGDIFHMIDDSDSYNRMSTVGNSGTSHQLNRSMYHKFPFEVVEIDTNRNTVNCVTANDLDAKKIPSKNYHSIAGKSLLRFRIPSRSDTYTVNDTYVHKIN